MALPDEQRVRHTAQLARLRLDGAELADLARDFATILDAFRSLQQVESPDGDAAAEPDAVPDDAEPLREDLPRPGLERADLLAPAPAVEDGFFRVPRVIEQPTTEAGE